MRETANVDLVAENLRLVQRDKALRAKVKALEEQLVRKDAQIDMAEDLLKRYRKIRFAQFNKQRSRDETAQVFWNMLWKAGLFVVGLQAVSYLMFEAWLALKGIMA